jgi:hypothetical protein
MRSHARNRVFVCCSNPDCHHKAEIDAERLSGRRDLLGICNRECFAPCAIIAAPTLPVMVTSWLIGSAPSRIRDSGFRRLTAPSQGWPSCARQARGKATSISRL